MASSEQSLPIHETPVEPPHELTLLTQRQNIARMLVHQIRFIRPGFRMRVEHLAAILLVDFETLDKGRLSSKHPDTSAYDLKYRLDSISPFCKHYMLHLNPRNLDSEPWAHTRDQVPMKQPPVNQELLYYDSETIRNAAYYDSCFRTLRELPRITRDIQEEASCLARDGKSCVVTGKPGPRVFYFIPPTWNDTVEHNDATGILDMGSIDLVGINLLRGPCRIISAGELGMTHKSWNMLCLDPVLYECLTSGLCAFKYKGTEDLGHGEAKVALQFYWMPHLMGRFNQDIGIDSCGEANANVSLELINELRAFYQDQCPPPSAHRDGLTTKAGKPLRSGHIVHIKMSNPEALRFEAVVKIQWACIMYTALCGGAGRAWYLTGMDLRDGSLQPRDNQFKMDQLKKGNMRK